MTHTMAIWAFHTKVGRWCRIEHGLDGETAVVNLTARQDRVRRSGQPCRFVVLPDGKEPT